MVDDVMFLSNILSTLWGVHIFLQATYWSRHSTLSRTLKPNPHKPPHNVIEYCLHLNIGAQNKKRALRT